MSGLITHTTKKQKLSCLYRKFRSSSSLLESPPDGYARNRPSLDPSLLLGGHSNLRGLTLAETRAAHALLLKSRVVYSNIYTANNLIGSYSKCSGMDYAFKLFENIPLRNLVTWNLLILGCNQNFLYEESWRVFFRMHNVGVAMDEFTYGSVLSACGALEHVARGAQVYGLVMKNGFFVNEFVRAGMIVFFAKCLKVEDALMVLYDVECDNVVCWNAVVSGALKSKEYWVALDVFTQMCCHGSLMLNAFTFSSALTACAAEDELELGRSIHGHVIKIGCGGDVFVGTAILDFYVKCGAMFEAIRQFKLMPIRNVVTWTAIIFGFVQKDDSASAFKVLKDMKNMGEEINSFTVSSLLSGCANPNMFKEALQIHCWILKVGLDLDPVVKASLINTYSKAGAVNLSEIVFQDIQDVKQVGVYANMISAYVQIRGYEKAIILLQKMLRKGMKPDRYSISSILSIIDILALGRQVHGYALKLGLVSEVSVGSSILTMYSKCGNLEESLKAFEQLERKDNIAWTSMIAGFTENGCVDEAILLFKEMEFEVSILDEKVLAAVLNACSTLPSLKLGREIHALALQCGFGKKAVIGEALVNMYSKCGDLYSAEIIFHTIPFVDQVPLSCLISSFSQRGHVEEALRLFHDMLLSGLSIDAFTISSILGALADSNRSNIGCQLHAYIIKVGFESKPSIGSSLVMMYSKCGSVGDCDGVFCKITEPDLVCWTAMIASYAHNGKGLEALELFDLIKKLRMKPDAITFVGVLSACSHSGLVEEGYFHLNSMVRDYGLEPGHKHYACMVDLLGRAGRLEEAERFIADMPIKPDSLVWETLLAACKVHGNHELGKVAAEKIMELQPLDAGAYVSVSNIYAEAGEWENVVKIRGSIEETGVRKKEAGWSFV